MTKQTMEKLVKLSHELLLRHGFRPVARMWHDYYKTTKHGEVGLTIKGGKRYKRRGYSVDIFAAFEDAKRARAAGIPCNPYSGKRNFLFIETEQDMKYAISQY